MQVPSLRDVDLALAYRSLRHFVRVMWSVVESRPFVGGWHIDAVCDHLEAVTHGQIHDLIINIPPRHTKSLTTSVLWPAWEWLHHPESQWLFSSYAKTLSLRDSVRCRRLIQSPQYTQLLQEFQPDLVLLGDQNAKERWENNLGGYRISTSVDGAATGDGGDRLVVDDPHNVKEGESDAKREAVLTWWDEVMSSRLNDPDTGAKVIIQQRVHSKDLTGHILTKHAGEYTHLKLPMRYEADNPSPITSIGFQDPRTNEGEILSPDRYSEEATVKLERALGSYAAAGQLQQRPAPRGGGIFKVSLIQVVQAINKRRIKKAIRYWDKAGSTAKGSAWTAGTLLLQLTSSNIEFVVADVVRGQWEYKEREPVIKRTAELDALWLGPMKYLYSVWVEQEPGSGGKESAQRTVRMLAGFDAHQETVSGDKVSRAQPFSAQIEIGNVAVYSDPERIEEPWIQKYLDELANAPTGTNKDQWDSSAGAFNKLTGLGEKEEQHVRIWGMG